MADFTLHPLNDFAKYARLKTISSTTGEVTPLKTGTVTAFLSTGGAPSDVAADATLSMSAIHIKDGKWLIFFDASVLTLALLESKFATTPPYLILQHVSGFRVYYLGDYVVSRSGEVA